ncbi:MAG: ATP-binding protein [Pseudomonadota bacterium]
MGRLRNLIVGSPRQAYSIGLALIALLVTIQFFGLRIATARQEVAALEINLAGRQRMLSQRIAWIMSSVAEVDASSSEARYLRGLLGNCTDLMARSHNALRSRDRDQLAAAMSSGSACLTPDPERVLPVSERRVDFEAPPNLALLLTAAWNVAAGQASPAAPAEDVALLQPLIGGVLGQLDEETRVAQQDSIRQLEFLLSINWVLILILVVGEVLLIFRPMSRAVESAIAKLKDSNARLAKSEQRLRDYASTAAHQFWETNADQRLVWIGDSDSALPIEDESVSLGKRLWELPNASTEGIDESGESQDFTDALAERRPFMNFEFSSSGSNGNTHWWRLHGRPYFADDGTFLGYRGTAQEITREHELAVQVRRSERMQSIGRLTAGVAHDFNNLLTVIQANAEMMLLAPETDKQDASRAIVAASQRGAELTQRLLAFGRVQRIRKQKINVVPFLEDLEKLLVRTLGQDFKVNAVLPSKPLWILTDRHQLEDACLNLALNARDATNGKGRLEISASPTDVWELGARPESRSANEFVCLSFVDNGPGIPKEARDKIFEPFFTTKSGDSSGLGLSMVYGFVHQSGGQIKVKDVSPNGTAFELHFPRAAPRLKAVAAAVESDPEDIQGKTALVVEDNDSIRELVVQQLESMGLTVAAAADGATALARLRQGDTFDIMILDVVLPGDLDGIDVYRLARELGHDSGVLFCSGFAGVVSGAEREVDVPGPMLRKPFSRSQLASAVSEGLRNTSARETGEGTSS